MSYAIRNSLTLGVLLALVLATGAYWTAVHQAGRIDDLTAREASLAVELDKIQAVLTVYDSAVTRLGELKARWESRNQVVPMQDTAARTLAYLNDLVLAAGRRVTFDFLFKGHQANEGYNVNRYALEGEARFQNLCAFIWNLEHGRRFYTVDHLDVVYNERNVGEARWNWVTFRMAIQAYYEPNSKIEALPQDSRTLRVDLGTGNPFRPHITRTLPENRDGLFEVDGARLQGLTSEVAFVVDRDGERVLLREGDRVFMGRLATINLDRNLARFVLNKGGIVERHDLHVELTHASQ